MAAVLRTWWDHACGPMRKREPCKGCSTRTTWQTSPLLAEHGNEVCQTHAGSAPDMPSAIWGHLQHIRGDDGLAFAFAANGWQTNFAANGWITDRWLALALAHALDPAVVRRIPAALAGALAQTLAEEEVLLVGSELWVEQLVWGELLGSKFPPTLQLHQLPLVRFEQMLQHLSRVLLPTASNCVSVHDGTRQLVCAWELVSQLPAAMARATQGSWRVQYDKRACK